MPPRRCRSARRDGRQVEDRLDGPALQLLRLFVQGPIGSLIGRSGECVDITACSAPEHCGEKSRPFLTAGQTCPPRKTFDLGFRRPSSGHPWSGFDVISQVPHTETVVPQRPRAVNNRRAGWHAVARSHTRQGGAPSVLRWHQATERRSTHMRLKDRSHCSSIKQVARRADGPHATEIRRPTSGTARRHVHSRKGCAGSRFPAGRNGLCAIYGRELKGFAFVRGRTSSADDRATGAARSAWCRRRPSWPQPQRPHQPVRAGCCRWTADWKPALPRRRDRSGKAVLARRRADRRRQHRFGPGRRSRPRAGVPEEPAGSRCSLARPVAGGSRLAARQRPSLPSPRRARRRARRIVTYVQTQLVQLTAC